jgi:hypothetical protein
MQYLIDKNNTRMTPRAVIIAPIMGPGFFENLGLSLFVKAE